MRDKLTYLDNLINELSREEKYVLLVFLLRCQLVEYSIKYLLVNYPFKTFNSGEIEMDTLGRSIGRLEKLRDDGDVNLTGLIDKANEFNSLRGEVVHRFLTSSKSVGDLEVELRSKIEQSKQIEGDVHYYFDYLNDFYKSSLNMIGGPDLF